VINLLQALPPLPVLSLSLCGFSLLYAPQPLLPTLAGEFGVTPAEISLVITVTFLPLALAPLFYGYVLEHVSTRPMLIISGVLLGVLQAGIALAEDWPLFLSLRLAQGLILPALLTALMTYAASMVPSDQIRQSLSWYIASTILGGFVGRALSGMMNSFWDWRSALGIWSPFLILSSLAAVRLPGRLQSEFGRVRPGVFFDVLIQPGLRYAYLAILCVFMIFAGLLNVLPFRLGELDPGITSTTVGLAYGGYLTGFVLALAAHRLRYHLGSERHTFALGIFLYAIGLTIFILPSVKAAFGGMFVFCGGMFLIHTRLSGQINQLQHRHRGLVNGAYIAAYYFGGSLGSWLPSVLYRHQGWGFFLGFLFSILGFGAWSLHRFLQLAEVDRVSDRGQQSEP